MAKCLVCGNYGGTLSTGGCSLCLNPSPPVTAPPTAAQLAERLERAAAPYGDANEYDGTVDEPIADVLTVREARALAALRAELGAK